jgi:catechol-2,3-dioxygenase
MRPLLKAVVLKTSRLRETQVFFGTSLGMKIEESSLTHFVIYAKGIRILFVESNDDLEVELYFTQKSVEGLTVLEDPNQIKIIIS